MESFIEVAKCLIDKRKASRPASELQVSVKVVIDILNNMDGIEVVSPFG